MPDPSGVLLGAAALLLLASLAWRLRLFASYMRFVRALRQGRLEEADRLFDLLLARVPRLLEQSLLLAQAGVDVRLLGVPLPEERVRSFFLGLAERGRKRRPASAMFLRLEGNLLRQDSRLPEGLDLLQEATRLAPGDPVNRQQLGLFRELSGDLAAASSEYRSALDLLPRGGSRKARQRASLLRSLAQVQTRQGNLSDAAEALAEALVCDPASPEGLFTRIALAGLQERLGRHDQAAGTLRGGLSGAGEGSGLLRQTLVTVLTRAGRLDEAERELAALPEGAPKLLARAEIELLRGRPARAREELEEAAGREPRNPAVQLALARFHEGAGDDERAMVHLERAVEGAAGEAPPGLPWELTWQTPRERLGDCYARIGRLEDAEREYRRARKEGSANPSLQASLAAVLRQRGRPEEAAAALAEARATLEGSLLRSPADPRLHQALGSLLLQQGEPDSALGHLERARDLGAPDFFLWRDLGEAQLRAGQRAEARASWERALEGARRPDLERSIREKLERLSAEA